MSYIPDSYDMWASHDAEQEAWLQSRPVCSCCEEHIQEDSYYEIGDMIICEECLDNFKKYTD